MSKSLKDKIAMELEELLPRLQRVSKMITTAEEDWPNHYDRNDPEEQYLRSMFYQAGDKLDDAVRILKRAFAEALEVGVLQKQSNGRYALGNREFTSGESIEYLAQGMDDDTDRWVATRIEHNGVDYYIVDDGSIPLQGLIARIKRVR